VKRSDWPSDEKAGHQLLRNALPLFIRTVEPEHYRAASGIDGLWRTAGAEQVFLDGQLDMIQH
jgi:hypothetical protein